MTQAFPRVGILARSDNGGLGAQTHDWFKHMRPYKVMLIDIDLLTGYQSYYERYEDCDNLTIVKGLPQENDIQRFLDGLDVVFTIEAPYNHYLYKAARERGVKTVCQYNFEFLGELADSELPRPDLYLAPSKWRMNEVNLGVPVEYMHVPVDRKLFPFKLRTQAKRFLHIAGHQTVGDRNGTITLLEALPFIHSDIEIVIRTQDTLPRAYTDHKLTIEKGDVKDRWDIYNDEDVLILPRRYGGLSLQLNEAMSLGMVPLMLDVEPQNEFLNKDLLIPAQEVEQLMVKKLITVYGCTPETLAARIDAIADTDISAYSHESNLLARERGWNAMEAKYRKMLLDICSP